MQWGVHFVQLTCRLYNQYPTTRPNPSPSGQGGLVSPTGVTSNTHPHKYPAVERSLLNINNLIKHSKTMLLIS